MAEYQLEIKQLVNYPRCRIYRQFIRTLMEDGNIRLNGCSHLFYFTALCSYANFRTSYCRIDGISYTVYPGEWVCLIKDVTKWFRAKYQHQAISILDYLQKQGYITYSVFGRGKVIKFKINDWDKSNTVLDYNAPCQKDDGFFFFPISKAHELVSIGKCSEMDIILDLWLHTIYRDEQVSGSFVGPVVYYRNSTGNPTVSYAELGERWGVSKATAGRILKKLSSKDYLTLVPLSGRHGTAIYLSNYLSTMFNISDVMIDKEEVAMSLNIRVSLPDNIEPVQQTEAENIGDEQLCVSENEISVSKSHIKSVVAKAAKILSTQGVACCGCSKSLYKLLKLSSDCKGSISVYELQIGCGESQMRYRFELRLTTVEKTADKEGSSQNEGE